MLSYFHTSNGTYKNIGFQASLLVDVITICLKARWMLRGFVNRRQHWNPLYPKSFTFEPMLGKPLGLERKFCWHFGRILRKFNNSKLLLKLGVVLGLHYIYYKRSPNFIYWTKKNNICFLDVFFMRKFYE